MPNSQMHKVARDIIRLLNEHGDSQYGGEAVTQREHALQCALLAEQSGAKPSLIAAALVHDIGHLLHNLPDDAPEAGVDDQHEVLAASWLSERFPPSVVEPVRLHVAAKRYLCATDPIYYDQLSEPSRLSLRLQGGPMTAAQASEFLSSAFCADAINLRRWDDAAKVAGLETPPAEHFASVLNEAIGEKEALGEKDS